MSCNYDLNQNILNIKGVGEKTAELFKKLNIVTVDDLLHHYPIRYEKYKNPGEIDFKTSEPLPDTVCIYAAVSGFIKKSVSNNYIINSCMLYDGKKSIKAIWYNSTYIAYKIKPGFKYIFTGRLVKRNDEVFLSHPVVYGIEEYKKLVGTFKPVYGLTGGLSGKTVIKAIKNVSYIVESIRDYLPESIRIKYNLLSLGHALRQIHNPLSEEEILNARKRLAFDDFFLFLYNISLLKNERENIKSSYILSYRLIGENYLKKESTGYEDTGSCEGAYNLHNYIFIEEYLKALPYSLTSAQHRVMTEILSDMSSKRQMHRLIQGDVGSGKTAVAFGAIFAAYSCGFQGAVMVPTEILACQHYKFLLSVISNMKNPPKTALLTGSVPKKEKLAIYELIKNHDIDIVIGTHAVIQEGVEFSKLAVVVTDEQHRFGVKQRQSLYNKGSDSAMPHVLVMSATPIPRTLALILYGDMDSSVIDTKPEGRLPVKNVVITPKQRNKAYIHIDREIKNGRQAYIICPLVEESEGIEAENLYNYREKLAKSILKNYNIDIIHGKMKQSDKDKSMSKFIDRKTDILISTTVIEVGIDIPNATVMMIEDAQRFGLASLHQLRGRIGRGDFQSYCIFVKTDQNELSKKRLDVVGKSNDGFYIASQDLKLRGPGELFGLMQSGIPVFSFSDIFNDSKIFDDAKSAVDDINDRSVEIYADEADMLSQKIEGYQKEFYNKINL